MKILFLGEKVQNLGGFNGNPLQDQIKAAIADFLKSKKGDDPVVLTSLNLGVETWAATTAMLLGIPYHTYVAFDNPHCKWPFPSRKTYSDLLRKSSGRTKCGEGEYSSAKMLAKDAKMVDDSDIICTFFHNRFPLQKYIARVGKPTVDLMLRDDSDTGFYIPI